MCIIIFVTQRCFEPTLFSWSEKMDKSINSKCAAHYSNKYLLLKGLIWLHPLSVQPTYLEVDEPCLGYSLYLNETWAKLGHCVEMWPLMSSVKTCKKPPSIYFLFIFLLVLYRILDGWSLKKIKKTSLISTLKSLALGCWTIYYLKYVKNSLLGIYSF